jgi:hypothetical protein
MNLAASFYRSDDVRRPLFSKCFWILTVILAVC